MTFSMCLEALQAFRRSIKGSTCEVLSPTDQQGKPVSSCAALIKLPWCGRKLSWHVVFQTLPPFTAPDIIFDDDSFMPLCGSLRPDQTATLSSLLSAWPSTCSSSSSAEIVGLFKRILACLLAGFKEHQLGRIQAAGNERIHFELSMLPDLVKPSIPVNTPLLDLSEGSPDGAGTTSGVQALLLDNKAYLSLPMTALDLHRIAPLTLACSSNDPAWLNVPQGQAGEEGPLQQELQSLYDGCRLNVAFQIADPRAAPEVGLQLPSQLQGTGGCTSPPLPSWEAHSSLMEIIPQVTSRVQPVLDSWTAQTTTRIRLIEALTASFGHVTPVELNLAAGIAQWAMTWDTCPCLITVNCCAPTAVATNAGLPVTNTSTTTSTTSATFPEEKPLLIVTNMRLMLMQAGTPAGSAWWRDYPWSPRWTPVEMATRIAAFLRQEIPKLLAPTINSIPILMSTPAGGAAQAQATKT